MRGLLVVLVVALLAGCASGLPVRSEESVVLVEPHGADCQTAACPALGAAWGRNSPEEAFLNVRVFFATTVIYQVRLDIDGRKVDLEAKTATLTTFAPASAFVGLRSSTKSFLVPLGLVRELAQARSGKVQVLTSSGYLEAPLPGSKAQDALRRFVAEVDSRLK